MRDLTEDEVNRIRELIDREFTVEGDLRREVNLNIKRLMEIGCYRGIRHRAEPAGARPAHAHECAHAEGAPADGGRPQQGSGEEVVVASWKCEARDVRRGLVL